MHDLIFFSYSHADNSWRDRFLKMLGPALQGRTIDAWSDQRIPYCRINRIPGKPLAGCVLSWS